MSATVGQTILLGRDRAGRATYKITFSSSLDDPTFYVWDMATGAVIYSGQQPSCVVTVGAMASLSVFVSDDSADAPSEVCPGRMTLRWWASETPAAGYYSIEEYVAGEWVERAKVLDNGAGYFTWQSRWLEDVTTHQFRVVAAGADENQAAAVTVSGFVVRYPDPPDVTYTYDDSTNTVTIAAA